MLAFLAPLLPFLGDQVAKLIFGDSPAASKVADAAVSVVSQVTGISVTDEHSARSAAQALTLDPEMAAQVQAKMADQVIALIQADNADRANAREQTVELARAGSGIAWGAPAVSLVVLGTFGAVLYRVLTVPIGQTDPNAAMMLGALTTMATAVVSYWVGSSAGSAAKDKLLRGR